MSIFGWYLIICYLIGIPASFWCQYRIGTKCPVWLYKVYTSLWSPILVPALFCVIVGIAAVCTVCSPFEWACNQIGRLKDRLMPSFEQKMRDWVFHLPEEKVTIRVNRRGEEAQSLHEHNLKMSGNQMPEIIDAKTRKLKGTWYNV